MKTITVKGAKSRVSIRKSLVDVLIEKIVTPKVILPFLRLMIERVKQ